MSHIAADGAVLVAAAVQAAIRESASLRCVAAVAAAVAGKVLSAAAQPTPAAKPKKHTPEPEPNLLDEANDPVKLLATLRAVRSAQRARKKERRRAAKQAATNHDAPSPQNDDVAQSRPVASPTEDAAGKDAESRGVSAAKPALASVAPPALQPPQQAEDATSGRCPSINSQASIRSSYLRGSNVEEIGNARIATDFSPNGGRSTPYAGKGGKGRSAAPKPW
jgi:hypothetical protein